MHVVVHTHLLFQLLDLKIELMVMIYLFVCLFLGGWGEDVRTNLWNKKRNDKNELQIKKAQKAKLLNLMIIID
jgi:NADH:ubiquinone oxidoreductase subunit H